MIVRLDLFEKGENVGTLALVPGMRCDLANLTHAPFPIDAVEAVVEGADPGLADTYRDALLAVVPNVGSVWHWEPLTGSKTSTVVQVTATRWNGEEWWVGSREQDVMGQIVGNEHWNELGRWMEACVFLRASDEEPVNRWPRSHSEGEKDVPEQDYDPAEDRFEDWRRALSGIGAIPNAASAALRAMVDELELQDRMLQSVLAKSTWNEPAERPWGDRPRPGLELLQREFVQAIDHDDGLQSRESLERDMRDMRRALTEAFGWREEADRQRERVTKAKRKRDEANRLLTIARTTLHEIEGAAVSAGRAMRDAAHETLDEIGREDDDG